MRLSLSIRPRGAAPAAAASVPPARWPAVTDVNAAELRILEAQLERMRGMLFGYSSLFFSTIRNWTFLSLGLLVLGWSGALPAAVVPVPFIVPFAFLESGYLFWYTVFARRHAERLEEAINERLGREVLAAHRLEAAYFYPPDAPKIAAFSLGNPLGFMGGMTIGYTAGAALLWAAGLASTNELLSAYRDPGFGPGLAASLVVPGALAWTLVIAGYLAWVFLRRADEERLLSVLQDAYRLPEPAPELPAAGRPAPQGGLAVDDAGAPAEPGDPAT